jgi:hypothetical protein
MMPSAMRLCMRMKATFSENNFGDVRFLTSIMTFTPSTYFEDNTGK